MNCEWRRDRTYDYWMRTGCGGSYTVDGKSGVPATCPRCGKKVDLVDTSLADDEDKALGSWFMNLIKLIKKEDRP